MEAIALGRVQLSLRSAASRVASSWIAIGGGLSIGREGPLIEMASTACPSDVLDAFNRALDRRLGLHVVHRRGSSPGPWRLCHHDGDPPIRSNVAVPRIENRLREVMMSLQILY